MGHVRLKLYLFVLTILSVFDRTVVSTSSWKLFPAESQPQQLVIPKNEVDMDFEKDFDWQLLNILKDEVQDMRKDLTSSFIQEHSRKKRALEDYANEAHLGNIEDIFGAGANFSFKTDDVSFTTTLFQEELYVFQQDGIYKIEGLDVVTKTTEINVNATDTDISGGTYSNETTTVVHSIQKVFIGRWGLVENAHVVATIEKGNALFILVEELHEGYSFLFTYAPKGPGLVLRQRIRNSGRVTAAKFFIFYDHLYLIIASDNEVHSLTSCPIFKWVGTHVDEIHVIQTRGASAVDTVIIEGHQYIAVAQAIDAAGNTEIGTQIVRMNRHGELEKVQLLYSNQPVELHFTKVYHEYILIVAQHKEAAIIYFYGGYDFIHLQTLSNLKGSHVSITSVLGPDSETYILAASGSVITLFMREATNSPLTALMFAPYADNTYTVVAPNQTNVINVITGITAKAPLYNGALQNDVFVLAITWGSYGQDENAHHREHFVELYSLVFHKITKDSGLYKQPEDKLSKCLLKLQNALETSEPYVRQLQMSSSTILRKSADTIYDGMLNSQTSITLDTMPGTRVEHLIIKPHVNPEDESKSSPSHLQWRVQKSVEEVENRIHPKLDNLLLRDQTNTLTGDLNFPNGVTVRELNTKKHVEFGHLNEIPWQDLRFNALRTNTKRLQTVTGNWSVDTISSEEVHTGPTLGGVEINEIFLTHSEPHQIQRANANFNFTKNVDFHAGIRIPPNQKINDIEMHDIINTTDANIHANTNPYGFREVTGLKTAEVVKAEGGVHVGLVNNVNLAHWYDSVLKTVGPNQVVDGVFYFNDEFNSESLRTRMLNGKDWDAFLRDTLLDGVDQSINSEPRFNSLHVDSLVTEEINGVKIRDLLNKHDDQTVLTNILLDKLKVFGDIYADRLNGVYNITRDNVVHKNENADVYTPVNFHNLTVNYIELDEHALLSGVDVLHLADKEKTVTYTLKSNNETSNADETASEPYRIHGNIFTADADVTIVNGISLPNFFRNAMKASGGNAMSTHHSFYDIPVTVQNHLSVANINGEAFHNFVKIDGSEEDVNDGSYTEETVHTPLRFKNAMVHGKVIFGQGVTLNDIDLSEFAGSIVHTTDHGVVHGVKRFARGINAQHGIQVDRINDHSVSHDIVMLRNGQRVYDIPEINFTELEAAFVVSHGPIVGVRRVDGLDLTELEATTVYINRPATIHSSVNFVKSIETQELIVGGMLNNYSVADIAERCIPLDTGNQTQYVHLNSVLEQDLNLLEPAEIDLVNGVGPAQYFSVLVNRSEDAVIHDTKTFKEYVTVDRNLDCEDGVINDINLLQLESEAVSKTKNQIITGGMVFTQLNAPHIISSSLCGIPVSDFVRIDHDHERNVPEEVNTPVHFETNEVTEIHGNVDVAHNINGYNITEITENLLLLKGSRHFLNFECQGDLSWNQRRSGGKGLSFLFNEAVRIYGDQNITGHVKFLEGFEAKQIESYPWLNGVDLKHIELDAVFDGRDVNFTGWNTIPNMHIGNAGSLEPLDFFSTNFVNYVNLHELQQAVVKRNGTEVVQGTKTFKPDSLTVESLFISDVNGCGIGDIARLDDNRVIESASLDIVEGITDLHFQDLDGFQWKEFLANRVTLDAPQVINGDWTVSGDVFVDNFEAHQVNDLLLDHAVLKNSPVPQEVHGSKTFGSLIVNGDIQAHSINGYEIDNVFARLLHKSQPHSIAQTIVFEGPVLIKSDLHIEGKVNDLHDMDILRHEFDTELEEAMKTSKHTSTALEKSKELLHYLDSELGKAAVWLDYLKLGEHLKKDLGRTDRVEVASLGDVTRVGFSKMIPVTENHCGLPNGCLRSAVDVVEFGANNYEQFDQIKCKNFFDLNSELSGKGYTLVSHAVSYNQTCSSETDGDTYLFGINIGNHNGSRLSLGDNLIGSIPTGFITDAKIFHSNGMDYIVIAQFYDKNSDNENHQTELYVYAIENGALVLAQTLTSFGPLKIALEFMEGSWFLGVANSHSSVPTTRRNLHGFNYDDHNSDDGEYSAGALSEIYVWITSTETKGQFGHFRLLREVVTQNVVDVEFIHVLRQNPSSGPHHSKYLVEAFVAFVHSGNVIEIYKFEEKYMNFVIMQTIALGEEHKVTSIHGLVIRDVTYLVVGSVPQGLLIYDYRGIEGFKLYLEVPLTEVQDVNSFYFNQKIFFPIASSSFTFIAETKIEGPAFP